MEKVELKKPPLSSIQELTYRAFVKEIAKDYQLSPDKEYRLALPTDKKSIKRFVQGDAYRMRIFDGVKEYPYMLDHFRRNDEAFSRAVELRYLGEKSLQDILREAGITLKSAACRICESAGWSSEGTRYFYKNYYTDV